MSGSAAARTRLATRAVALVLSLVSGGCAGMRPHHPAAAPAAAEKPAPDPQTQIQTAQSDTAQSDTARTDEVQSKAAEPAAAGTSAPPACTCVEAKPKPRPRTKHKHVRKEPPPQLSAPVAAETPPGSTVFAEVRSTPVSVMSILGRRVKGPKGEDLGRVVDVLADASGRVRTAIIDFGGFLGVGNHRIAVDWPLLRFDPTSAESPLLLSVNVEQLRTAPEYKDNPRPQTLMEPEAKATPSTDSRSDPKK